MPTCSSSTIPFPGLPLLHSMDESSVWAMTTQGEFFANDRFAAVPRSALSAYFEGWKLIVTGEAEDVFLKVLPRAGVPVFLAEGTNCEAWLYARLEYAGVGLAAMPAMAYVQCAPGEDWASLRTLGYFSCTPFSGLFSDESGALTEAFGGCKYPTEVKNIIATDTALQDFDLDGTVHPGSRSRDAADELWNHRLVRLFSPEPSAMVWTTEMVYQATTQCMEREVRRYLKEGSCTKVETYALEALWCRRLLTRVLALAQSRNEYYWDALELSRAMLLAAPLHFAHWIRLISVLMHPTLRSIEAAHVAYKEARKLNPAHPVMPGLGKLISEGGQPRPRRRSRPTA
ncbi:unnamed protein product, partial [Prorocentrum cordatum]